MACVSKPGRGISLTSFSGPVRVSRALPPHGNRAFDARIIERFRPITASSTRTGGADGTRVFGSLRHRRAGRIAYLFREISQIEISDPSRSCGQFESLL